MLQMQVLWPDEETFEKLVAVKQARQVFLLLEKIAAN